MLLPSAAHAGHWSLTATGSCTGTLNGQPATSPAWNPPTGTATNSISFDSYEIAAGGYGYPQYHSVGNGSASYTISATVTGTWVSDGTSDDTPLPSVLLQETSGAYYKTISGIGSPTASDGLSPADPVVLSSDNTYSAIGTSSSVAPHFVKKTGSPWTESLTITASASASSTTGFCKADVGFSGLTVSIHAQPYNWHITKSVSNWDGTPNAQRATPGALYFEYNWSSTDGDKNHLTDCFYHEIVTYKNPDGSVPASYHPPAPFTTEPALDNPYIRPIPTAQNPGLAMLAANQAADEHFVWAYTPPPVAVDAPATQQYVFNDRATGKQDIPTPSSDNSSTATIDRSVTHDGNTWTYHCTESGVSASKPLQVGP